MDSFNQLQVLLQKRCGLFFSADQQANLLAHIQETMYALRIDDMGLLVSQLELLPLAHNYWRDLLARITIGETYFFRNRWHFAALRDDVLPALIQKRRLENRLELRIWSAGCSTGEEPYSLAILLRELIPDIDQWRIDIFATDINETALEKARQGRYTSWSFRIETPESVLQKYFEERAGVYEIVPEVRQMVRFGMMNLVEDTYPHGHVDLILCRNVTIYFDRMTTRMIANRFWQTLEDGGWLVVGHSEPLASLYSEYEVVNYYNAIFYRKGAVPVATPKPRTKPLTYLPQVSIAAQVSVMDAKQEADYLAQIRHALDERDFQEARQRLHTFLENMPDHIDALFLLAKLMADTGRIADVHRVLDTIDRVNPLVAQAHYLRALVHQQENAPLLDIKSALRRALYADRRFALAHYTLGEILLNEGQTQMARRSWQNAIDSLQALPPDSPIPFEDGMMAGTLLHIIEKRMTAL